MQIQHYRQSWPRGAFPELKRILATTQGRVLVEGLAGSADAWLIAELFNAGRRTVLVCVEGPKRAETLVDECRTYLGDEYVRLLPSRDAVPYNQKSPFGPTTETRLGVLSALLAGTPLVIIAPHAAMLQRVPTANVLFNNTVRLEVGRDVAFEQLGTWLSDIGFRRETRVENVGSYAVRGGIVDIYPYNTEHPLRCEFFGETIESIRRFSVYSQKSLESVQSVDIGPMREFCLSATQVNQGVKRMLEAGPGLGADMGALRALEHQWLRTGDHEGIEWYHDWFDLSTATVLDYLPADTVLVWDDLLDPQRRFGEVFDNYKRHLERVPAQVRPVISGPEKLLAQPDTQISYMELLRQVFVDTHGGGEMAETVRCNFRPQPVFSQRIEALVADIEHCREKEISVTILSPSLGHAERLVELLGERASGAEVALGYIHDGFIDPDGRRAVYTDASLFAPQPRAGRSRRVSAGEAISSYDELVPGDVVVHVDHGIAQFTGIERVAAGGGSQDCMVLQYAERARLYVPLGDFHRVQKYVGKDGFGPPLSKLGSGAWERTKSRTRDALKDMAQELVELYAKRQYLDGIAFDADAVWQREFEDAFMYDETVDQQKAIGDIKKDMESSRPMDRLVCGDVGFGKTEVAMRAAFKAVMSGRQVVVLAPTTILVAQHFQTVTERMAGFPIRIGMLSRFLKPREQKEVAAKVAVGEIDILIGTHRALSADVQFKNLGLLIIDEEQRFGVRHKERLKQYRFEVDVLSMTATPIPRTLHMSLVGARDLSVIMTPPRDRLPIETHVSEYHDDLLQRAILDELDRGGQVYLVDNRISHLYRLLEKVEALVPKARAVVAHGQMEEQELARIMREFVAGRFDILIATTIIENGLDIPNVNTIVINRADLLGLSQLYQLRGRVGRSSEQAFAWLLIPSFKSITDIALKRLRALEQFTDLGSGFQIAMRDLEIRGAGNILGTRQHGSIVAVGFEMYCSLLKEAIDEIQGRQKVVEEVPVKVDVECDAYLPTDYVPDAPTRVALYRQLSAAQSREDVNEVRGLLADRFGPLPPSVVNLLFLIELKVAGRPVGCERVSILRDGQLTLFVSGSDEAIRAALERIIRGGDGRFEIVYEKPVRARAKLNGQSATEYLEETLGLLTAMG